jgi:hypothetical protein
MQTDIQGTDVAVYPLLLKCVNLAAPRQSFHSIMVYGPCYLPVSFLPCVLGYSHQRTPWPVTMLNAILIKTPIELI